MKWIFGILLAAVGPVQAIDIANLQRPDGLTNGVGRIVARWDDALLQHVRLNPLGAQAIRGLREEMSLTNSLLLHTRLESGVVKTLVATETGQEWRTRPGSVWHSRIIGVLVEEQRIYVAHWTVRARGRGLAFLLPAKDRPKTPLRPVHGTYILQVFRKSDGHRLHTAKVPGGLGGVPAESVKAGPLRAQPNGVECFGTRLSFKGDQLVKPRP